MLNAGIPDIAIEPDKTLHKVKDKLKLGERANYEYVLIGPKLILFKPTIQAQSNGKRIGKTISRLRR